MRHPAPPTLGTATLHRARVLAAGLLLAACAGRVTTGAATGAVAPTGTAAPQSARAPDPRARDIPERLSDAEFWKLLSDVSEPGGYFRIEDNYTSNEMEVGQLHTMLRRDGVKGGVYLGVGPEQNFTYISAIRPTMAFVVDIRRQAVMQHLMYKAMFEMAADRGDFLSMLFAKPRPAGIDATTPIQRVWALFEPVPTDSALAARNYQRVTDRLTREHGFTFTPDETRQLKAVYDAFVNFGPGITTRGGRGGFGSNRGFADLTGFSMDTAGVPQSFLSTEEHYRTVKALHDRNLFVPVSGDFAGPKAVRAIGGWLRDRGAVVSAFYVSNVEQYLFQDGKSQAFYENVGALPVDSGSVFIRPYSMRRFFFGAGGAGGAATGATRSLCPIAPFLRAAAAGRVTTNDDALSCMP